MIEFPKDFFWGAATSAYQVEGGNSSSDWSVWEKQVNLKDPCGSACRHYDLFWEDFDLAKSLGHNCHRLSIEWARVEPEEGVFSEKELNHYKEVVSALIQRGIEPVVTLHHFTNPIWFACKGGWLNSQAKQYFLRYVEKVTGFLASDVRFWVTINEPNVYTYFSYLLGQWPPQHKSLFESVRVMNKLAAVHIKCYKLIRSIYKQKSLGYPKISIAQNMQAFVPCIPSLRNELAVWLRHKYYNLDFIDKVRRYLDFIGVNYYSPTWVELSGWGIRNFFADNCKLNHRNLKKNSMGWDIYPQGLYDLLISLKKYNLPVFILENGICTEDDSLRWDYIKEHLASINRAMLKGVNIWGYIYWSLLDNFEWDKGFAPRFGLIDVDYNNYRRSVRDSARQLAQVSRTGRM